MTTYYRILDGYTAESRPVLQKLFEVRRTSKGAWLCWGWQRERGKALERSEMRWVADGSGRRFAYPTVAAALDSYTCRKNAQIRRARAAINRAEHSLAWCGRAELSDEVVTFNDPVRVTPRSPLCY